MAVFAGKQWNDAVFQKYLETVPRVKQNAFIKAGVFRRRDDIKGLFPDQVGGNYALVPMTGLLGGTADNYDGTSNVTLDELGTFLQGMIVVGRMHGWKEQDFTFELTKKDFMEEVAAQVGAYWDEVDQGTVLATLAGIFGMQSNDGGFVDAHTYDITSETVPTVGATTLNSAIQQACGANKNIFTMAIMHSVVATNLENLEILEYRKQSDANGIQRTIALADWNGRTVLVDDDCPVSGDDYTTYILGANAFDYVDVGAKNPSEISRDPITKGGIDMLINRQRKIFAPRGITFKANSSIKSPTDLQLSTGSNWEVPKDADNNYFNHKAIPIARIISKEGQSLGSE